MRSKYEVRGAYHYAEFKKDTPYRRHVLDLVEQVTSFVDNRLLFPKLLDIGCGEGLVMSQFSKQGFQCTGLEVDKTAIKLGREKGNTILDNQAGEDMAFVDKIEKFDVVLLCDVLEHTTDPIKVMNIAKQLADIVVVATPDREDKHATHEVRPGSVVDYFMGWELLHCRQRHARWLMIFKKIR